MHIPGPEIGSRWDIEFTFEPTDHIRDVLVSAFARLSRDTLRFEAMNTFDPGVWRIDIRLEVVPVPGLVCSLVVGGTPHSGFGISSAVEDVATTVEIASYFQDVDEWLQWPTLPDGRHLTPRIVDGRAVWGRYTGEVVAPIGELTDYIDRLHH
ncbi:hypothetical protein Y013_25220 (plasmid) [Rhodococcus pyridinivorans SB3094]|uniref:Uncharacterized protein n=1 Tax=Rhodococcus pyridinivorans SB3094 TaxID=1435356 RepID=V9XQL2_9NOCA|nr:hypothetical protein [Rhodococcus pyridinivorans]AHD24265.1 hypothetical protein Y013_25220 [Rhodococcus pyridinivorans SB3094]